jgi:hypothetical protein
MACTITPLRNTQTNKWGNDERRKRKSDSG